METRCGRVLVVDDDPGIVAVVSEALEEAGYEVQEVGNGGEALRLLEEWRPDVILLDLAMPVVDGPTFRSQQRWLDAAPHTPVVLLSGRGDIVDEAERLGAAGLVAKPFEIGQLVAVVEHASGVLAPI